LVAGPDRSVVTDWIAETFTSDTGWDHLETLVDIGNRMAGQSGEMEGLEATRDAFDAVGARDARVETFDLQGWVRGESSIETPETVEESIALPRSPAGEVTAELVDLGNAVPADFEETDVEGKIVVASSMVPDYFDRYIHRTEKYQYAVEGGAVAFVYANHVPGQLPPTGSVGGSDGSPIGDIPAVGVSSETGARLGRRFDGEDVTVTIDCETPDAESGNAVAELGPDTEDLVILSSHVDAHDIAEGARDNGAGTATIVEVARALAQREDELDTRVKCIAYGAEEVGLVGSSVEAEALDHDAVKAIVNVDSNMSGRTLQLTTHRFDELADAAGRVAERFDHPIDTVPRMVPHSDHWPFVRWGVPGYMVSSSSDDRGRGWGHTSADTLEKLEPRTLREQAILLTELVVDVAGEDVEIPHEEAETMASYLKEEDQAEGMKKTGGWPYEFE
jgi:Zn-dependent M28 family amino/carboxypeptidase